MDKVVILGGAGAMGRIIVTDLLRTARAVEPVVADLAPADRRAPFVRADVTDPRSLKKALRGAFAVVASLPYRFNLQAMGGALASGAHYVDLGGLYHTTRRQLRLRPRFERAGLTALLGMGSSPGITNVLARHAGSRLDRVLEVHCEVASVDRTIYREAPPLGFGYSPDTLLDEFLLPSAVFRRGRPGFVPPLDRHERVVASFPRPLGRVTLDTTLHSEVATLPASFPGVREVTFRQGFDPGFAERLAFLVRLGLASTDPVDGTAPRSFLLRLLRRFPPAVARGRVLRHEVLRARVLGTRGGHAVTVLADCRVGPSGGWGIGPDIDTGAPPSIAVQMLLSGEIAPGPGVFSPEEAVPPPAFFRELARRGMRVTTRVAPGTRRPRPAPSDR